MFSKRELKMFISLLNAEIMKSNLHYGLVHDSSVRLYKLRDKCLKLLEEVMDDGERDAFLFKENTRNYLERRK